MMEIRLTELKDLPLVMEIYDNAFHACQWECNSMD